MNMLVEQMKVQRVIYDFFRHLDNHAYDPLCSLLASTGVWFRNGVELKGRAAVMEAMQKRPIGFTTRHLVTNVVIDFPSLSAASANYYMTVFVHEGASAPTGPVPLSLPLHVSVFDQKFVHEFDHWSIAEIKARAVFHSPAQH